MQSCVKLHHTGLQHNDFTETSEWTAEAELPTTQA
jgi:hypothetical protein